MDGVIGGLFGLVVGVHVSAFVWALSKLPSGNGRRSALEAYHARYTAKHRAAVLDYLSRQVLRDWGPTAKLMPGAMARAVLSRWRGQV